MDKGGLDSIVAQTEKENQVFAKKSSLGTLSGDIPDILVGRENETRQIVRYLLGYRQGHVVPLISIFGRSGTGKSTLVRFVCNNMPDIQMCFANLRKAKTVFGAANLIMAELGQPNLKSAQGMNNAIEIIQNSIIGAMTSKKLFVLVLDEFDVMFYDKRGNPSDFVYKLVEMQSEITSKGYLMCIITISNNVIADYELDDRVRSRIGTSEVFFAPYSREDILEILRQRAKEAFGKKIDDSVLNYCASLSHLEHGDARRAVDLLRVATELAALEGKPVEKTHVDSATERLQQDRITQMLSTLSYHAKVACMVIAMKTYGLDEEWHYTSTIYEKYQSLLQKETKPLTYRRFSEILKDLENTGLISSQTGSRGRGGYGSRFKLNNTPELVGRAINAEFWQTSVVDVKNKQAKDHGLLDNMITKPKRSDPMHGMYKVYEKLQDMNKDYW